MTPAQRPGLRPIVACLFALAGAACGTPAAPDAGDAAREADAPPADAPADTATDAPADAPFDAGLRGGDLWARYCAFAVSCAPIVPPLGASVSACALGLELSLDLGAPLTPRATLERGLACANTASDCAAFARCYYRDHGAAYCAAKPGASCDGDLLVSCATTPGPHVAPDLVLDCAAAGLACREVGDAPVCTNGAACTPGATSCDGATVVGCDAATMRQWRFACPLAQPGAVCVVAGGQGRCAPSSAACLGTEPRCEGDVLVTCDAATLRQARLDCAAHASHCGVLGGGGLGCVADASECSGVLDTCDGGAIRACVDGVRRTVDCRAIGLATCTLVAGTAVCSD